MEAGEGFLDMGARIVTTTHSNQLKDWAMEAQRLLFSALGKLLASC